MVSELLERLREATTGEQRREAYRALKQVGMDKATADIINIELKKEG